MRRSGGWQPLAPQEGGLTGRSCCLPPLGASMARTTGERAPAFTPEELEKLVVEVLPMYAKLYGSPEEQVNPHQKQRLWRAIAKKVRTLGLYRRRSSHCRKRWEDLRRGTRKSAEVQLGQSSQPNRRVRRTLTPLMARILAVAYPELDVRLSAQQQLRGASTQAGGGDTAAIVGEATGHGGSGLDTDTDGASGPEGEVSAEEGTDATSSSSSESSSGGHSLAVADPSGAESTPTLSTTPPSISTISVAPQLVGNAHSPIRGGVSFAPGTSAPAPVTPAALSEEAIDLLKVISVGQTALLSAIQGLGIHLQQMVGYLEGIHGAQFALQRSFQALASSLTAAFQPSQHSTTPPASSPSQFPISMPVPSTRIHKHAPSPTVPSSTNSHKHKKKSKHTSTQQTLASSPSTSLSDPDLPVPPTPKPSPTPNKKKTPPKRNPPPPRK